MGFSKDGMKVSAMCVWLHLFIAYRIVGFQRNIHLCYSIPRVHITSCSNNNQHPPTNNNQQPTAGPKIPNDSICYSLSISLMNVTFLITVKGPQSLSWLRGPMMRHFLGDQFHHPWRSFPSSHSFWRQKVNAWNLGWRWVKGTPEHVGGTDHKRHEDMLCPSMWFSLDGCGPIYSISILSEEVGKLSNQIRS